MDILGSDDNSELAVDFDDIAFAERAGDDFHGFLDDVALVALTLRMSLSENRFPALRNMRQFGAHHTELEPNRQ
jgi:hypothetical protein